MIQVNGDRRQGAGLTGNWMPGPKVGQRRLPKADPLVKPDDLNWRRNRNRDPTFSEERDICPESERMNED